MKKTTLGITIAAVLILALAVTGFALAQDDAPPTWEWPYGSGMMPGFGGGWGMHGGFGGRGMMGWTGEYGPMHESMLATFADRLGLSVEELEARHEAGETMWDIATAAGLSAEDVQSLMLDARSEALEQAVADGLISPEQAEWMQSHMGGMWSDGSGIGFGGCNGYGAGSFGRGGRMGGGRWQNFGS